MGAIKTTLTFEEFEQLPDQPGKRELLNGEVVELPPAEYHHNEATDKIQERLRSALREAQARGEGAELGQAHKEMGYKLSTGNYVIPDVSITHAGQQVERYLQGAPAIAIEVISPNNSARDIDRKIELYFQHGAREVWVFYPDSRHAEVRTPGKIRWVAEDECITTPLLPGLALSVREILGE